MVGKAERLAFLISNGWRRTRIRLASLPDGYDIFHKSDIYFWRRISDGEEGRKVRNVFAACLAAVEEAERYEG